MENIYVKLLKISADKLRDSVIHANNDRMFGYNMFVFISRNYLKNLRQI